MTPRDPDRLDYPHGPGWKQRETAAAAALAAARGHPRLQAMVLAAIRLAGDSGLTADEAAVNLGLTPFSARPRVSELAQQGLIADDGRRRANLSGRKAIVWVIAGPRAAAEAARASRRKRIANEAERAVRRVMKEDRR